ncbi:hypothetical protein CGRA01v4_02152 [Colletotrichum graminicola]|nr:hypothetical protein CGRA01v4_02152 [Colletotrichum graminicola]
MAKRHALLFLLSLISRTGDAATFGPAELARALPETYCFTYLSTFLELASLPTAAIPPGATVTVIGGSTVTIPSVIGGTTVDVPGPGATTTVSGAGTTVTVTGAETTVRPSPSASARAVSVPIIFFVNAAPATNRGPQKQGLQKRDYGGFLNNEVANNRGSCDFASNFTISALGQLLEAGNPVFYIPGETFKEMRSAGVPPPNAITGTFDNNNGVLRIVNPELPNGEANFCQVLTGQVYLTFNSTGPPGCQPVLLYAYNSNLRINGQLVGVSLPTGSFPSPSSSSVALTASTSSTSNSFTTITSGASTAPSSATASLTSTSVLSGFSISSASSSSTRSSSTSSTSGISTDSTSATTSAAFTSTPSDSISSASDSSTSVSLDSSTATSSQSSGRHPHPQQIHLHLHPQQRNLHLPPQ